MDTLHPVEEGASANKKGAMEEENIEMTLAGPKVVKEVQIEMTTMEPQEEISRDLFHEFTNATTIHGLRYVFIKATGLLRRMIWLLILMTAIVVFLYLNAKNVEKLLSHPKKIDMDVSVKDNLTFPAVTICNYNRHKFSEVANMGLFDSFYTLYYPQGLEPVMGYWYHYRENICVNDPQFLEDIVSCKTDLTIKIPRLCDAATDIHELSSTSCEQYCSSSSVCTGFWYNRTSLKCNLLLMNLVQDVRRVIENIQKKYVSGSSPVTWVQSGSCGKESLEFYEKMKDPYLPELSAFKCTFDTDCQHIMLMQAIIQEASHPPDFSDNADRRRYLYSRRHGQLWEYFSMINSYNYRLRDICIQFYYYFLGGSDSEMSVWLRENLGSRKKVILGNETGEWKRFHAKIPDGEGYIMVVQRGPGHGMAIDDFEMQPCHNYGIEQMLECNFTALSKCGYESIMLLARLEWKFDRGSNIDADNDAVRDGFMYVKTDQASEGDRTILRSPPFILPDNDTDLTFNMHNVENRLGTFAAILVVLVPENQTEYRNISLKTISLQVGKQKHYIVKLPRNDGSNRTFYVDWIYTMGFPSNRDVALDTISIQRRPTQSYESIKKVKPRLNLVCEDFSSAKECPINIFTDSAHLRCSTSAVPMDKFDSRPTTLRMSEGVFESPGYPANNRGNNTSSRIVAIILAPENSSIQLQFHVTLSTYSEDMCESHLLLVSSLDDQGPFHEYRYCLTGATNFADPVPLYIRATRTKIIAVSNYTSFPVFRGTYKIVQDAVNGDNQAGHSLLCYKSGRGGRIPGVRHTISIATDPLHFESPQCLSFLATTSNDTFLRVVLKRDKDIEVSRGSGNMLGRTTIPPGTYIIKFEIEVPSSVHSRYVFQFEYVKAVPGFCFEQELHGNVTCNFSSGDNCGYLDISLGNTKWMRSELPRSIDIRKEKGVDGENGMLFKFEADEKTNISGHLLSPWFRVDTLSCLYIAAGGTSNTVLQVYLLNSLEVLRNTSTVNVTSLELNETLHWMEIELGWHSHYIMFGVGATNGKSWIYIDNVQLQEEACVESHKTSQTFLDIGYHRFLMDMAELIMSEADDWSYEYNSTLNISVARGHKRKDYTVHVGVDELYEKTAHNLEDLIFNCTFNHQTCDLNKDFLRQRTEFGICYTFNPGGDIPLKYTTTPGSDHGLHLVINSEAYEITQGITTDSGIKVHVHDQDDIPYAHLVGLAAPLSHHTYFAISMQEFNSLGDPHGNCGSRYLDLFPNATYTRFRCNQQCLTKQWEEVCKCRNYFMPGKFNYCNVQRYLKCSKDLENMPLSCDCPTACHMRTFSTRTSMSSLSKVGVAELLLEKKKFKRIAETYKNFLLIQRRTLPSKFVEINTGIGRLYNPTEEAMLYRPRLKTLQAALHQIYKITQDDITGINKFLQHIMESESCFNETAVTRLNMLRKIVNDLEVVLLLLDTLDADVTEIFTRIKGVVSYIQLIRTLDKKPCMVSKSQFVKTRFVSEDDSADNFTSVWEICKSNCAKRKAELDTNSKALRSLLNMTIDELTIDGTKDLVQEVKSFFHVLAEKHEMHDFQLGFYIKKALSLQIETELFAWDVTCEREAKYDLPSLLQWLYNNINGVSNFFQFRNTEGAINALQWVTVLKNEVRRLLSCIEKESFAALSSELYGRGPKYLYDFYMDALTLYSRISLYLQRDTAIHFDSSVYGMKIWQWPQASLDDPDLINYQLTQEEVPLGGPLAQFVLAQAPNLLHRLTTSFFKDVEKMIEVRIQAFQQHFQELEEIIIMLNDTFHEAQEEARIDEDFIRENFLVFDVFYDELTQEITDQTPAYEINQFWSDVGGYLGLLLGASVITIFEFLDFTFHYIFVRCKRSRKISDNCKRKDATPNTE